MFDGSIGAGSVLMPYGGKYQLTETQAMVAKLPVLKGKDRYRYHDELWFRSLSFQLEPVPRSSLCSSGIRIQALWLLVEITSKIRFTFQEYFRSMTEDPKRWSQPFAALLGAYSAQIGFGLPSIGGKDSMSGTFNEIDVPPTLVSFAVDVASDKNIMTPELKKAGDKLVLVKIEKDEYDLPKYDQVMDQYGKFHEDIKAGRIVASYALDANGLAAAVSKMAFGNGLGVKIEHSVDKRDLFEEGFGCIVGRSSVREGR